MKILVDLSNISVGGGVQVASSLVDYINTDRQHSFYVVLSDKLNRVLSSSKSRSFDFGSTVISTDQWTLLPFGRSYRDLRKVERKFKPDITFTLFGPAYWKAKKKHIVGFARPHYIVKDSPFFSSCGFRERLILKLREFIHNRLFVKNSDVLYVENEGMVAPLSEKYGKRVFYIPNTYHQVFGSSSFVTKSQPDARFELLTISANYKHKNLTIIPRVVDELNRKYPAFDFQFNVTVETIGGVEERHRRYINFLGPVAIEDCPSLYQKADAMFLPTLLECFSASYAEAMISRTPILTSDLSFARSICSNAALYFNPEDPADIADKIYALANDKALSVDLVNSGLDQIKKFRGPEDRFSSFLDLFRKVEKMEF